MTFGMARGLTAFLISFAIVLQGIELLKMAQRGLRVWSKENVEAELKYNLPLPLDWVNWFAQAETFTYLAYAEIGLGVIAFVRPTAFAFFLLLVIHIAACLRFRGSINGGSDAMTAMVLIGMWIAYLFKKPSFASAGLVWIAVNVLISYARAGLAKIQQPEWREGTAIPSFLQQSFYADIRSRGAALSPENAKKIAWAVMAIEFALVLSPLSTGPLLQAAFLVVVLFHFLNFWAFGLNRFFWAWIAAWPSIFFLSGLLHPVAQ